jgi:hypothetical protein
MKDKFSGRMRTGIWLLTLEKRRFEEVHLGRDPQGRISVVRPLGDLHLSYVNQEEEVVFDNLSPIGERLLPYHPHTIGQGDWNRSHKILRQIKDKP